MEELNYKKLGLKIGLEIHQQLNTQHKIFCKCSTAMQEKEPMKIIKRKLHPVTSELGELDATAQFEYLKDRTFHYQFFRNESCLVEGDCEPPYNLNRESLEIALQIALLFNCRILSEIQIMRKTVIDGSNPSGFQRTAITGINGYLNYRGGRIPIAQVCLEEDSSVIVKEGGGIVVYRLNRLGIPLVEISTGLLEGYTPEEIQEIAYLIGITCRSTGKTKSGIGSIRQDINVSIEKGARVEIKGVQELNMIGKIVENEVKRQLLEKAKEETRMVLPDGTTKFMRPLPGASRMYPETDLLPISISTEMTTIIKKSLPEPWTKKLTEFKSKLKLSDQLAKEMLRSEHLPLFEKLVKITKVEPSIVASTFTQIIKDLDRRDIETKTLTEKHFLEIFNALKNKKMAKEAVPEILVYLSKNPESSISTAIKELNLTAISTAELKKIIKDLISQDMMPDRAIGIVMSKVRGKIDAQTVIKTVKEMLKA